MSLQPVIIPEISDKLLSQCPKNSIGVTNVKRFSINIYSSIPHTGVIITGMYCIFLGINSISNQRLTTSCRDIKRIIQPSVDTNSRYSTLSL